MATYDFIHVKCPEQEIHRDRSRVRVAVKRKKGNRERGMGFHFEVKNVQELPGDDYTCPGDIPFLNLKENSELYTASG